MNIYIFLITLLLTCVSCTVEPPINFIKEGVQTTTAILFLQQLQDTKNSQDLFNNHIEQLDSAASVDFDWAEYWNQINQQELYKKLNQDQLNSVFQLSRRSCDNPVWSAFADLLLQMAKDNEKHLYFRHYLTGPDKSCPTFLPDEILKKIIIFLAKKRDETEVSLFSEEKVKLQSNQEANSITENNLISKYPYTVELYGVIVDEWSIKKHGRAWGNILNVVNRQFWADIRWLFYHVGKFANIKTALEMEMEIYQSATNLVQDILLIFQDDNMKSIMDLVSYATFFEEKNSVNWKQLWQQLLIKYPEKPDNNNNSLLLSFYEYSCQKEALTVYMDLIRSWDIIDRYRAVVERECEQIIRITQEITQYVNTSGLPVDGAIPFEIDEMNDILEATKQNRSIGDLVRLLNFYDQFKMSYSILEWQVLLERQFSMDNWLYLMKSLRQNYDKSTIRRIMDMHQYIYQGRIPFLSFDVFNILVNENIPLDSLVRDYSYSEAQLESENFITQFWSTVQENPSEVLNFRDRWINLFEYGASSCNNMYLNKMVDFFDDNKQVQLLLDNFNFDSCPNYFLDVHFKEDSVNSVVTKVRQSADNDPALYWDLIRFFSLYTSNEMTEEIQRTAIFKMNAVEWEQVFDVVIPTLKDPVYKSQSAFLKRTIDLVSEVYKEAINSSICQQLLSSPNSYRSITEYDQELVMYFLNQINWNSNGCNAIELERLNMVMFVLSDYLFSSVEEHDNTVDYVLGIWSQAVRIISIMEKIHDSGTMFTDIFGTWMISAPDVVNGQITHRAFQYYFSLMILSYVAKKISLSSAVNTLDRHIWKNSTTTEYHKLYQEILRDTVEEYPSHREEIEILKKMLTEESS